MTIKITYSKSYIECDARNVDVYVDGVQVGNLQKDLYAECAEYVFVHAHHGSTHDCGSRLSGAKLWLKDIIEKWLDYDARNFWMGTDKQRADAEEVKQQPWAQDLSGTEILRIVSSARDTDHAERIHTEQVYWKDDLTAEDMAKLKAA